MAIKILGKGGEPSTAARKRFERETNLVANLRHPNIITVFDSGETKDGRRDFIVDHIRGISQTKYVSERKDDVRCAVRVLGTTPRRHWEAIKVSALRHRRARGIRTTA